jgi:hypothetical protein
MLQLGPLDRDLSVRIKRGGDQGPAAAIARRRAPPWWRLAGDGRSRPSGLHFERGLAREDAHGTRNPPGGWHGSEGVAMARTTEWAARCSGACRRSALRLQG